MDQKSKLPSNLFEVWVLVGASAIFGMLLYAPLAAIAEWAGHDLWPHRLWVMVPGTFFSSWIITQARGK